MIFSFLRKKAESRGEIVPDKYRFAAACKKCGAVMWADSRDGYYWRICNNCKEGKRSARERKEL